MEHADVTLMPGALSHIRHMMRDEACKAIVLGTLLNIRLHVFVKYLMKNKCVKNGCSGAIHFTFQYIAFHYLNEQSSATVCVFVCVRARALFYFILFLIKIEG